jgi:hypothetical protein
MKYLKKYKIFESYNRFGTKTLTEVEFDQIRKENCKNWTKVETELYRGMPDLGDYLYIDPLKGDFRSSIEDTNIHLDLLSNLPSWKDYPKYERCVIGGSTGAVGSYGDAIYEVIPFDDVRIAVCPTATIWESFGNDDDEFGGDINLVDGFLYIYPIVSAPGETLGKIVEIPHIDGYPGVNEFLMRHAEFSSKRPDEITGEDCYNFINNSLFNPKVRGFQLLNYDKDFKIENKRQFWTEGPCLLIKGKLA